MRQIGDRVVITKGLSPFIGKKGTIIGNTERDGRNVMYRVRLDEPVDCYGQRVSDDLWDSTGLARRARFSHIGVVNADTTMKEARAKVAPHNLVLTKTDDEYRVNIRNGREATAYYTNDIDDAVSTGIAMANKGAW